MDKATQARLEHQLGVTLSLQRRHDEALGHMEAARALAPSVTSRREQTLDRAELLSQLGRFDEVAAAYEAILAADPLDLPVHLLLGELRYQQKDEKFLASYDAALARAPSAATLPVAKGRLLLKLKQGREAEAAFRIALGIAPDDAAALAGLGRALDMRGDIAGARDAYEKALTRGDGDTLEDYAGFLLRHDDAIKAEALAEQACRLRPASQAGLAVLGLCHRARNNPREAWLNDYHDHVQIFDLKPPEGYADMASFNRDLAIYLEELHGVGREYFTQTLRGGTQLYGDLFYHGHPLVDRLLPRITEAIQTYVARLKADPAHPLVARRGKGFRYAGSWSSRLGDRGFHVNHLHQKGWISSCYYVSVPDAAADTEAQQGWIKFGEPPAEFGTAFTPQRAVQPVPGRLVLFPSYMWHGTTPFQAPQPRITIAFDAVPG